MALRKVRSNLDRLFDKSLTDLIRGIRNNKDNEVSEHGSVPELLKSNGPGCTAFFRLDTSRRASMKSKWSFARTRFSSRRTQSKNSLTYALFHFVQDRNFSICSVNNTNPRS
ncbi:unnamed protein product [Gongylonema pulchrum]|uniref:Uncharacterized protein n=1 Tax=Gongylonema pulchrum TaxID=637853 RepID=A0A183EJ19_9BILA|nr:unnamed protein product [Gongylonema pulchrum]